MTCDALKSFDEVASYDSPAQIFFPGKRLGRLECLLMPGEKTGPAACCARRVLRAPQVYFTYAEIDEDIVRQSRIVDGTCAKVCRAIEDMDVKSVPQALSNELGQQPLQAVKSLWTKADDGHCVSRHSFAR